LDLGNSRIKKKHSENSSPEKKHGKNTRRLTKLVCRALLNPGKKNGMQIESPSLTFFTVQIPWDVEDYYWEHVKGGRDKKRKKYPNPQFGDFSAPLTVVDLKGRIVLWYLPGLLSHEQQVGVFFLKCSAKSHLSKIVRR
jgi:hypothetical protein